MMLFNIDTMTAAITAGILAGFGWFWGHTIAQSIFLVYKKYRKKVPYWKIK
jgi:hypothetical protein